MHIIVNPRLDMGDITIHCDYATDALVLTIEEATKLRGDVADAMDAIANADMPKLAGPVTPGRYRMGNGNIAVVTTISRDVALGYHAYNGGRASSNHWTLDGAHGIKRGQYPMMDLVERLPDEQLNDETINKK